jgi:hypothetical protein
MTIEIEEEIKEDEVAVDQPWVSRFDDTVHTVCCVDWATMLCGLIDPGAKPPVDNPVGDKCIPCHALGEIPEYCPNGFVCSQMSPEG